MGLGLVNDNWTLQLTCDAYSTAQTDALLLPKASESWVLAQLGDYSTTQQTSDAIAAALTNYWTGTEALANVVAFFEQSNTYTDEQLGDYSTAAEMNQAIEDALVPYGTIAQRDAAIAAALAAYYTSAQTDSAIAAAVATIDLTPYWTIAQVQAAITAALVPVTLSNGQSWNGGPTFNLLRGSNVLKNLSVAGALTASFQNLDDTILIESDSYARSETYTQLETGAAITAAIDALDLSQFQNEAQVLALIAGELGAYWDQTEVANYVGGQLIRTHQEIPGDLALPSRSVNEIGCAAKGGDLRQKPVYGGLQGQLQGRQLRPRGVGAGVLQREDGSVVAVQPGGPGGLARRRRRPG